MQRTSVVCFWLALVCCAAGAAAQDLVAPTNALSPADERKAFHLPPGFEAQLVAAEPDINKPMNMAFDARGLVFLGLVRAEQVAGVDLGFDVGNVR